MTLHGALSIIAKLRSGEEANLAALLDSIESNPADNPLVPFGKIRTIHFARFVICPAKPDVRGKIVPAQLIFTTNYDQPLAGHLKELIGQAGPGLWRVFSSCEDFPIGNYSEPLLSQFFQANAKKANTFYVGVGNRSVEQIKLENELRTDIEHFLDLNKTRLMTMDAQQTRNEIKQYVKANPVFSWAIQSDPLSNANYSWMKVLRLCFAILAFLILSPILIPFIIIWFLIVLFLELTELNKSCAIDKKHLESLLVREKGIVQNQFSAFGNVKSGWIRYRTMLFLLRLTDFLAPYLFSKGSLSGIPTVHFARWLVISEGRQMLFLSNYDGNSEGYLRDFIDIAAKQLTLLFSNTEGYPKTWLMIFGGAKDAERFMQWARQNQIITNVWYSANPTVSVKNIYQNSKIRNGLTGEMNEMEALQWLQLF
jgi:hypothetical protein